jgi:diguanylate cyclase (GGDEF)-like protein
MATRLSSEQVVNSEQIIRRLYQITFDYKKGFEHKVIQLLDMGLERFGLDIGILSKIEQNDYIIQSCIAPASFSIKTGDQFDLSATYCSITCAAKGPVALEHVAKDAKLAIHPAYKAFSLESYIGIPIRLNDELYGTLNFSSPNPIHRKFLDTDIDALQLMASWIEVELIRIEQEKQLHVLNQELKHQADYDSLTNIPNRRGMYKNLQKSLNQLSRTRGECTIAIIDIDYFKKLNDTCGHQAGDEKIVHVVNKITESIRDYEFVARIGGDEFLLWLPDTNQEKSAVVFQRIMQNIATLSTILGSVTVSIGACHFDFSNKSPSDFTELIDALMSKADTALYEAKKNGRNRFIYHEDLDTVTSLGLS